MYLILSKRMGDRMQIQSSAIHHAVHFRPNHIIAGEVRGEEVKALVEAMGTGNRTAVSHLSEGMKTKETFKKTEQAGISNVQSETIHANQVNPHQGAVKIEKSEKIEMTAKEMKIKSDAVKQKEIQDKVSAEQIAQSAIATLQAHAETLKDLSIKHQEATGENQKAIEAQAKEVLKQMREVSYNATFHGKNVLEGKHEASIPNDVEKVDMKELLKPEFIEKQMKKPLEEAKEKVDVQIQSISVSVTNTMSKQEVQQTFQKVKESLKEVDVKNFSSALDSRRNNVAYLLR
jgi:type VI protein secretion system component VasK